MNAYISDIAIQMKERGYIFNDLQKIPNPKRDEYRFVERLTDSRSVYITGAGLNSETRCIQIGGTYYKLT